VKGPKRQLRPQIDNPDTLGARITGLSSNHDYRFYVYARTKMGRGEESYIDVKTKDGERKNFSVPAGFFLFFSLHDFTIYILLLNFRGENRIEKLHIKKKFFQKGKKISACV
jgi:hypothetical protein